MQTRVRDNSNTYRLAVLPVGVAGSGVDWPSSLGRTQAGVRWKRVTAAAVGATAGRTWTALQPVPTSPTLSPAVRVAAGQRAVCTTSPWYSARPGNSCNTQVYVVVWVIYVCGMNKSAADQNQLRRR